MKRKILLYCFLFFALIRLFSTDINYKIKLNSEINNISKVHFNSKNINRTVLFSSKSRTEENKKLYYFKSINNVVEYGESVSVGALPEISIESIWDPHTLETYVYLNYDFFDNHNRSGWYRLTYKDNKLSKTFETSNYLWASRGNPVKQIIILVPALIIFLLESSKDTARSIQNRS